MPSFLVGSAYSVSTALVVWSITQNIIPKNMHLEAVLAWGVSGLTLAFLGVLREGK